jgi:hypothetical protein
LAIAKTGQHHNVPIAIAWVPSETTDNYSWFFLKLKAGGVPLEQMAVFVDRGKQTFSQKRLKAFGVNWLHLKYCTYHLAKNVCGKFGVGNAELERSIYNLQNCQSIDHYIKTLIDISTKFGVLPEHAEWIEDAVDISIMLYLLALSPTNFSVVGN